MALDPVYVTEAAERKPIVGPCGTSMFLELDALKWWEQFEESPRFNFKPKCFWGKEGEKLFYKLTEAVKRRDAAAVREVLPRVKALCEPNYEDLPPEERWARVAVQMPEDIGGPKKEEIRQLLTARARGRVLETMCGFNSYFGDSSNIGEVIALDFCKEMLERYPYPERTRILCDLERVVKGERLDFFSDSSFQTVGCWGSNYLSDPVPVFREFKRILAPGGKLLVLENTAEGYADLVKRYFNPAACAGSMREASLTTATEHLPQLRAPFDIGEYYLVEGTE